ncbi:hypothetical protein C2S53_012301 [Perilla frutescens var. hirtella]|uniref:Cytochrome P450 n=1 Tax=Perilla frutescens var. hirtella TaxID=608512 RepID=A0AAD4P1W4_PERFH|nr:hypothetical protein C2S53_012301 [Perilla frutescens var. hirtella]
MELLILLIVFSMLFLCIFSKFVKKFSKSESQDLDLIPGPKKLPVIGNLHLLVTKSPPHHVFRDLAVKYGGLMRLQLGGLTFLVVSTVEVAKQVLKTHDVVFANRPPMHTTAAVTYNYSDIALAPYGEYWRHLRKICTLELLSGRRVRSFGTVREEECRKLAQCIASNEGSPVNLSEGVYRFSFDITARAAVGKEAEEKRRMITAVIKGIIKLVSVLTIADLYPSYKFLPVITGFDFKIHRLFRQVDGIMQGIVNGHKAAAAVNSGGGDEDLVDVLLRCQEDDQSQLHLTDDNIKAVIMDMFTAGGESSSTAVDWAMSEMVRNPTTLKRAQDEVRHVFDNHGSYVDEEMFHELKYMKLVIKETLRMHPPLPLLVPRQSSERCEVDGYTIPAKTRVVVNAWAMGRDPGYWADGEEFMPERFEGSPIDFKGNNLEYIPFGAGRRICPGMAFGLANVEFSLAMLLYHFDWEMPDGGKDEELDMKEDFGATVRRKHDLLLIPTLKRPLITS